MKTILSGIELQDNFIIHDTHLFCFLFSFLVHSEKSQ